MIPKDVLLAELLHSQQHLIYKYHEHQSLLENKEEEQLDEEERKAAWDEFENEKTLRVTSTANFRQGGFFPQCKLNAFETCDPNVVSVVKTDYWNWICSILNIIKLNTILKR